MLLRIIAQLVVLSSYEIGTVDPNKIVPRRGPPSVDHKISDKKVNQIYIALLGHSYSAFRNLDDNILIVYAVKC